MDEKALRVLEFHKILKTLSRFAQTSETSTKISNLRPFTNIKDVKNALSETNEAREIIIKQGPSPIGPVADVRGAVKRTLIQASLNCSELLNIAHLLRVTRQTLKYTNIKDFDKNYPILSGHCQVLVQNRELEQRIFDVIISEDEIDDNASPALSQIRRRINSYSGRVKEILNKIIQTSQQALQEPIITMRGDRYVIPVKSEYKNSIPGVVHDTSASGATFFVEPMKVVEVNNEIRKLVLDEKNEIERILAELSKAVAENSQDILKNYETIINIDFIFAKAYLADEMHASYPQVNDKKVIDIKKGRHPLIDKDNVVPIDIRLGKDFDTLVITGPNTGGKTVSLKTLGLFTLMAQSGLHIPAADGCVIGVFEKIFADIGDEQSIEQSLSTFSSHMVNIVRIIEKADDKSLILFDELGAGTDPSEGAALAIAILKEAKAKGAVVAATTHYSEIKLYALSTDRVENAACEFDVETLRPTYKLLIGSLGKSNAFAIAERLGLARDIIESARMLMDAENIRFEDVVNKLEANRQKAERDREEVEKLKLEAEAIRDALHDEKEDYSKRRNKILDDARRQARRILSNAKAEIEDKIKEIEKAAKAKSQSERKKAFEKAKSELKGQITNLDNKLFENTFKTTKKIVKPEEILPGTTVFITAMGQKGTAIKKPDASGNVEVQMGILKIKTHISTIELLTDDDTNNKKKTGHGNYLGGSKTVSVSSEIDVRGQTLDEAIMSIDKYIDDAVLANLSTVTIIHGKGTGVLRNGVHAYLKQNKFVKSFRLGEYGEGDSGVTIAELK